MSSFAEKTAVSIDGDTKLRIIAINDVYELDYLPNYATCRRQETLKGEGSCATATIGVIAGDFLAPSLLSSLDKGVGMVDCLNLSKLDYASIGNHEGDVPMIQFFNRIRESNFTWINSNMTLDCPNDISLPRYSILQVGSKRVALLGLNTDDKAVFSPGAFNGCAIKPIEDSIINLYEELSPNVDLIIPLTHQYMTQDRKLASDGICTASNKMPLIIGGHDHEFYVENINGCKIVKTGADGKKIAIVDIMWISDSSSPTISIELKDCMEYVADATVAKAAEKHKTVLKQLEGSKLFNIPKDISLTSKGIRLRPTSCGTMIASILRDACVTDCCLIGAGSIRGNRSYDNESVFTYANLKSEIPFQTNMVILRLPGNVVCDMISFTRAFALALPPIEKGSYIQCDDRIKWDGANNQVLEINGRVVDPIYMYSVIMNQQWLDGMDNISPLLTYKNLCDKDDKNINKDADAGVGAKELLVAYFSKTLLLQCVHSMGGYSSIDTDGDKRISKEELRSALKLGGAESCLELSDLIINNLFQIADLNEDGYIDEKEIFEISFSTLKAMNFSSNIGYDGYMTFDELEIEAKAALGDMYDAKILTSIAHIIDSDGNKMCSKKEMSRYFESLHKKLRLTI